MYEYTRPSRDSNGRVWLTAMAAMLICPTCSPLSRCPQAGPGCWAIGDGGVAASDAGGTRWRRWAAERKGHGLGGPFSDLQRRAGGRKSLA